MREVDMFCRIPPNGRKPGRIVVHRSRARWDRSVKVITLSVLSLLGLIAALATREAFAAGNPYLLAVDALRYSSSHSPSPRERTRSRRRG